MAFSEKLRNTPSIIFLIFSNLHFVWKSVLSTRCSENVFLERKMLKKFMFPEKDIKSSFDSADQNFEIN